MYRKPSNNTKKKPPTPIILASIDLSKINAFLSLGLSFITLSVGGRADSANAANVSIIRLTHSICVTVNGDSVPMKAPQRTRKHAATFTVNWNNKKRCMFWNRERPHFTARAILANELSMIVISTLQEKMQE